MSEEHHYSQNVIRYGRDFMEMYFRARWKLVQSLWDYLKGLIGTFLQDSKRSEMISVAIIELIENAVKYSLKDEQNRSQVRFKLNMNHEARSIIVEVENPCIMEHYEVFKSEYERIVSHPNPKAVYKQKIKEAGLREDGKSQLGLVRIIVEAKANMRFELKNENIIVYAEFKNEGS
jgi:hypothetical protein